MENLITAASDVLTGIETAFEKAKNICDDLDQNYFSIDTDDKDGKYLLVYYYNSACVKSDIVIDYLFQMKELINEMRTLVNKQCEQEVE